MLSLASSLIWNFKTAMLLPSCLSLKYLSRKLKWETRNKKPIIFSCFSFAPFSSHSSHWNHYPQVFVINCAFLQKISESKLKEKNPFFLLPFYLEICCALDKCEMMYKGIFLVFFLSFRPAHTPKFYWLDTRHFYLLYYQLPSIKCHVWYKKGYIFWIRRWAIQI